MSTDDLLARHRAVLPSWLALYYDEPIQLTHGEGRHVWDGAGTRYLDWFGGILTTSTAHALPEVVTAVQEQAAKMLHTSTLYLIEQQMTTWAVGSDPVKKTVTFRVVRDQPVHVLSAESKRPEVTCQLVEVEKGRLYHLELIPSSTANSLLGIVRLQTDCEIESYASPLAYFSIQ